MRDILNETKKLMSLSEIIKDVSVKIQDCLEKIDGNHLNALQESIIICREQGEQVLQYAEALRLLSQTIENTCRPLPGYESEQTLTDLID